MIRRVALWFRRLRQAPARAESTDVRIADISPRVDEIQVHVRDVLNAKVDAVRDALEFARAEIAAARNESALRDQLAEMREAELRTQIARAAHEARVAAEVGRAPLRDAAMQEMLTSIPRLETRRSGLSICIITWNHAGYLERAIASAQAVLAALPQEMRGEILIMDDASDDETPVVLARYALDDSVRAYRAPINLNLSRARNILLHACETTHVVHLDADNLLYADNAAAAFGVARRYNAALTYGQVLAESPDGTRHLAVAYAPSYESLSSGAAFDSMCIVDVEQVELLGGYSVDAALVGAADDYDLLLRTLCAGRAVTFVPVVMGRYRLADERHSTEIPDAGSVFARVRRKYLVERTAENHWCWFAADPDIGFLYGSRAAETYVADHEPRAAVQPSDIAPVLNGARNVLVVAPGGVGNLGDDAITDAVVQRLQTNWPAARIRMVTDREPPLLTSAAVEWIGCVRECWSGLTETDRKHVRAIGADGGIEDASVLLADTQTQPLVALEEMDLVVFAGGGNLAHDFAAGLLYPRVALALAASAHGVSVIWSGQGVGPCDSQELAAVRAAATLATAFGCRDAGSVALVNGAAPGPAVCVGDDALGLPSASAETVTAALQLVGVGDEPIVVFHAREASYVGDVSLVDIAAAVDAYASTRGATVVGLAINSNVVSESEVLTRVAHAAPRRAPWRIIDASGSQALAAGLVARAIAVVTHSYHVALWALEQGTPAVLVAGSEYYERKAQGLGALTQCGTAVALPLEALTVDGLETHLAAVGAKLEPRRVAAITDQVEHWWQECLRQLHAGSADR